MYLLIGYWGSMVKSKNIVIAILLIVIMWLFVRLFMLVKDNEKLLDRNEALADRLHYEHYDELELLPCSICGEEVKIDIISGKYYIRCSECGYETEAYEHLQDVINRWNSINNSRQN